MAFTPVVYAFVFARGGSKGLPGKNIRLLDGKPLIAHSIEMAKQIADVQRIVVSTDDEAIASVAREWGAEVPFTRPAELAADTSSEWLAWRHALHALGCTPAGGPCNVFLSLPTTAPLRSVEDVQRCLEVYYQGDCDAVITSSPAARHPMFNMVKEMPSGEVRLAMEQEGGCCRRQDAPQLFDMTTAAYVVRPEFILTRERLMDGRVRQVVLPRDRAVDIDDEIDLAFAEFLLKRRNAE